MCLYLFISMPTTIHTEITIDASPESVSKILFDFNNYHQWNSWIDVSGPSTSSSDISKSTYYLSLVGTQLFVTEGKGEEELQYSSTIKMASPSVLKWTWYERHERFMFHEHYFEIVCSQKNSQQCVLKHGERFSGAMARAKRYTKYYQKKQAAFEAFNRELKMWAEVKCGQELVSK